MIVYILLYNNVFIYCSLFFSNLQKYIGPKFDGRKGTTIEPYLRQLVSAKRNITLAGSSASFRSLKIKLIISYLV